MAVLSSRLVLRAALAAGFMAALGGHPVPAEESAPKVTFEIEGADSGQPLPGIQPRPGETEAELNARLLRSFGEHPYGVAESEEQRARREELRERLTREAREELLFKLEARSLKRSLERDPGRVDPALVPSRRFLTLSQTLKVPQMLRDRLEEEVQQGRLSPYDLYDAERGFFDPTRRETDWIYHEGPVYYGRPLPSRSIVQDLLTYQSYLRARRYAQTYE